jgi:uncharacterized RDD family membrane protein YckC
VVGATQLVTPEAVVLDLPTASVGSRVLCRVIDVVATLVGVLALDWLAGVVSAMAGSADIVIVEASFSLFAALLVYPVVMEALWGGRTLGKAAMGLRVVRTDGGPISFRHAAVRAALGLIEVWGTLGALGTIVIFASQRDQRLGDMAAGTLVLREHRGGSLRPVRLLVPPGCEYLVQTMDVGGMTARDYELVRSFLVRWRDFPAWQRPAVAAKLAGPLWQRYKHPMPVGLGPDYYLACLGAAYQFRHPIGYPLPGDGATRAGPSGQPQAVEARQWGGGPGIPGPAGTVGPGAGPGNRPGSGTQAAPGDWAPPS